MSGPGPDDAFDALETEGEIDASLVRPFTLTGGRTRNDAVPVALQTVVCQSAASVASPPALAPVEDQIWSVAAERLSSAEISARLELPVGVVRVLVGDLVAAGVVDLGRTTATADSQLVRRLIDGVRAL